MRRILLTVSALTTVWGCSGGSTSPDTAAPPPPACVYTLSITSQAVAAGGGSGNLTVTRSTGTCGWTAASDASWLTASPTSGSDTATVAFTASANAGTDSRTGRITISFTGGSAQLTVTQAGVVAPPPPPPPPPPIPCTYSVDPAAIVVPAAGGTGQSTVTVAGSAGCSWTAQSNQTWIVINSGFTGTSTGTIAFTVAPNSDVTRFGRIIVNHTTGSTDIGFTQEAGPVTAVLTVRPNPCNVKANPNPPNTDPSSNTNLLDCTFDATGSFSSTGVDHYEFWLGVPTIGNLLSSDAVVSISNPLVGCGFSGGGDVSRDIHLVVVPKLGAPVTSPPLSVKFLKNGGC